MAWSVLQSASTAGTAQASTQAATYTTANLSSGTKIVAVMGWNDNAGQTVTIGSVKDGAGNSLTQVAFLNDTTNTVGGAIYAADTPAGDVGTKPTLTVTFSAGTPECSMWVGEVSGLATGNTLAAMVDGTAATAGFAAAASDAQPAYSSTASNEWLISCESDNGGPQTVTQPAGYTLDGSSVTNNSIADVAVAYKNSTNGAESGTWTFGGTTTQTALLVVAFKLPAGAVVPSQVVTRGVAQPPQPQRPPPGQVVSAPVAYQRVVTLSGSGTLSAVTPGVGGQPQLITPLVQPPQPAQPPPGRVVAFSVAAFTSAATLSGSGTLTASPVVTGNPGPVIQAVAQPSQPPQPPPGQITGAAPAVTFTVGATLSGSGTLSAAYITAGAPPYVVTPLVQPPQPQRPPPGQVVLGPAPLLVSTALTGSGTLSAAPFFSGAATLSGSGTLTASYTLAGTAPYVIVAVIQPPQPAQPPPARLQPPPPPPPPLFTVGTLTASSASLAVLTAITAGGGTSGGVLTATTQRAGGPS